MKPLFNKPIQRALRLGALLLTIASFILGLFTASAALVPYSWFRFDQYKNPNFDDTFQGHNFDSGYTGNGESPFGTEPQALNIAVGGPLGDIGVNSLFTIRCHANTGANQGCQFDEPNPLSNATFVSAGGGPNPGWGNFFQTNYLTGGYNVDWCVEAWVLPTWVGANAGPSIVFATGMNRNNRSPGRQSGVAVTLINGTNLQQVVSGTAANGYSGGQPNNDGSVFMRLQACAPPGTVDTNGLTQNFYIGPPVQVKWPDRAAWVHVAVVRDTVGTIIPGVPSIAWFTNGVLVAYTNIARVYQTNYYSSPGMGGLQDEGDQGAAGDPTAIDPVSGISLMPNARALDAYLAEVRWSAFYPGTFSTTNLLTRRIAPGDPTVWYGPSIVINPQSTTVWEGGAGTFQVIAASDTANQYQWLRNGSPILNATNYNYVQPSVTVATDNGALYSVIVSNSLNGLSVTSSVATLNVVANSPAFITGYSNAVMSEASLVSYFPMDGSSGTTINNVKDPTHNGTLFNAPFAYLNGDTNKAAGNECLSLNSPNLQYTGGFGLASNNLGYVEIQGDNPGFDFANNSGGNGTVEAVISMDPGAKQVISSETPCFLSSGTIPNTFDYYNFMADVTGNIYYQSSGSGGVKIWVWPQGFVGQRTHIAFVFSGGTNVTCYVNGQNLGTKVNAAGLFGNSPPGLYQPISIGKRGGAGSANGSNLDVDQAGYFKNIWRGSVDDVAFYNTALTVNQIQSHYFYLLNGAVNAGPSVTSLSPSKNLYTGFPVELLKVVAGGTPPYTYQWYLNNVALSGQTASSLAVSGLPPGSYSYTVAITNGVAPYGIISSPVVLTVQNPSGYDGAVFASKDRLGNTRPPLAYYPLNETNGTTIYDWAGTHDGTLSGAYQLGQAGPVAGTGALRMFGTNVTDPVTQYQTYSQVVVPYYPELNPEDNGNFSQEFWYSPDNTNTTICAVSSQFDVGNNKAGMAMMLGNNTVAINQTAVNNWTIILGKYNNVNQGVQQNGTGGVTPGVAGQWQHVAGVADGDDSLVTLYVNGVPEQVNQVGYSIWPGDSSVTGGWNQNYFAPLILGNRNLGQFPMAGRLSEVAIYDYALTYTDITNHSSQVWSGVRLPWQANGSEFSTPSAQVQGYITNGNYFVVTNVLYGPIGNGFALTGGGVVPGTVMTLVPPAVLLTNVVVNSTNTIYTTNAIYGTNIIVSVTNLITTTNNLTPKVIGNMSGAVLTVLDVNYTNTFNTTFTLNRATNTINYTNSAYSTNKTYVAGTASNASTNVFVNQTTLSIGQTVNGGSSSGNPIIVGFLTGTGGVGTYTLSVGGQATPAAEAYNVSTTGGVGTYLLSGAALATGALNAYVGPTIVEGIGQSYTINVPSVLGAPNTFQWYKNGSPVANFPNLDGTDHYPWIGTVAGAIQGTNAQALKIAELRTNDTGLYTLQVNNAISGITNTSSFYLAVLNDTSVPHATLAQAKGTTVSGAVMDDLYYTSGSPTPASLFLVEVKFDKRMDLASATNPANYTISGGVQVTNAYIGQDRFSTLFGGDYHTVGLVTSGLTPGANYTLTVSNVYDEASFSNRIVMAVLPFSAPVLRANAAVWNYYYRITNSAPNAGFPFDGLQTGQLSDSLFPYVPQVTAGMTNFSSDAIAYNQNLGNNPAFFPVGGTNQTDNYVSTLTAWITPTNTGYYEFFINADDYARLYINPNGPDPAGAQFYENSLSGSTIFSDYNQFYSFIPELTNGQPYFIQAVHYENGGGDSVRVAWRYLGTQPGVPYDGTGINGAWLNQYDTNLVPIDLKFLSAYTVAPPIIGTQPVGFVAPAGKATNMFITVVSTSTGVTNITWQRSNAGANSFSTVSGRTGLTNVFSSVAFSDYGDWRAQVDDGTVVSPTYSSTVTVRPPTFTVTPLPTPAVGVQGQPHSIPVFSTASSGSTSYQWRFNGANLINSANYSGATSQVLQVNNYQPLFFGNYDCIVSDGYNSVTSSVQVLNGYFSGPAPSITPSLASSSALNLSVPTQVGVNYDVQYTVSLVPAPVAWTTLFTVYGNGSTISTNVSTTGSTKGFYRIKAR